MTYRVDKVTTRVRVSLTNCRQISKPAGEPSTPVEMSIERSAGTDSGLRVSVIGVDQFGLTGISYDNLDTMPTWLAKIVEELYVAPWCPQL